MDCPWDGFTPATISFCEARLCEVIAEPANAFTSLSKSVVGLWLVARCLKVGHKALWAIAVAALLQGPLGFSLHATGTFWGEALDVSGMFLISATLLSFGLSRRYSWSATQLVGRWIAMVAVSIAVLLMIPPSGIALFTLQVIAWLAIDLPQKRSAESNRWLKWMLGVFAAGFAFWIADKTRFVCDPNNHLINGHAIWHLATSACLALFFEYEASALQPEGKRAVD